MPISAEVEAYAAEHLKPFVRPPERTRYERIRSFIMLPFGILRLLLSVLVITLPWNAIARFQLYITTILSDGEIGRIMQIIFRAQSSFFATLQLKMLGFKVAVHGEFAPRTKEGLKPTVVVNHQSYLDILVLIAVGCPSFVARIGSEKIPLFGAGVRVHDCVLVDRSSEESRKAAKEAIHARMQSKKSEVPLLIFPEGTTTNGNYLIPFKTSAFEPGVAVQPIVIKYRATHFKPYWVTLPIVDHIKRTMAHFRTKVDVYILPAHIPTEAEKADPVLFAQNVRMDMGEAAKVPLFDVTTRAKFAYQKARVGKMDLADLKALVEVEE
ncbi:Lysophospholipid acyltransferase [Carpediemonas membranifera]|uniref:Lysophospholipid acyltransferase n=1 Tax=Carpediemonas membranifera TaxID=201153 RepID=A0A8J6E6I7_9EUKA|nr:Lysophospholipid acyltransferase [Carpediemonas membranifera]|eukprot:KAG9389605.1 Lysophospholipid acyltransferase [Carpediemonas membranifera]